MFACFLFCLLNFITLLLEFVYLLGKRKASAACLIWIRGFYEGKVYPWKEGITTVFFF